MSDPSRAMLSRATPSQMRGGCAVVVGPGTVVVGEPALLPVDAVVVVVGSATGGVGWNTLVSRSCPVQRTYPAATCGTSTSRVARKTATADPAPGRGVPDR